MEQSLTSRLKHAWNAFTNRDPTYNFNNDGVGYTYRPDRPRLSRGNEKSIVTSVYNKIALDVASVNFKHCKMDDDGRYISDIKSGLNDCLNVEANIDQTGKALILDIVMSMLDEGCVAIVPIDTTLDPKKTSSYDILTMRTAKILEWKPKKVKVRVYNDNTGEKEELWIQKTMVSIVENPLYSVINEPNSTMQRLIRKLSLLDITDEQTASGKLDLIIQLPYVIKTEARRIQAEDRRKDIESQLSGSKYGIAYTDGTEKITQLNRSLENNLMAQIEYLTNQLFSQLGISLEVLNGTANEQQMLNYYNRTIAPIVTAITDEMRRKFLTKTARTQNQTIAAFRDPFKLVPINNIAEIADKFTRNEILTSNEVRQIIGMKPAEDPKADQLVNSNMPQPDDNAENQNGDMAYENEIQEPITQEEYDQQMAELDSFDNELDDMESDLQNPVDETSSENNVLNMPISELMNKDEIKHYASEYYDPVKAHEYYLKNRELKGRTSTSTLNEEGKKVADYVKNQIYTERNNKIEESNKQTDSKIESLQSQKKSDIQTHKDRMNLKITSLRNRLKNMSPQQKEANRDRISKQINDLREDNQNQRDQLQEAFISSRNELKEGLKTTKSNLKTEYDEKYASELDKIKSESKYLKSSKKSSSNNYTSSSNSNKKETTNEKNGIALNMNLSADREHVEKEKLKNKK